MIKVNCLLLLVLFMMFSVRTSITIGDKKAPASMETSSAPVSDENPEKESAPDDLSTDSEDECFQHSEIQSLYFESVASRNKIQLQQQIFEDLSLEVATPPPKI